MGEKRPVSFFNQEEPLADWPFPSISPDRFEPFASSKDPLEFPADPSLQLELSTLDVPLAPSPPHPLSPTFFQPATAPPPYPRDLRYRNPNSSEFLFWPPPMAAAPTHLRQRSLPDSSSPVRLQSDAEFAHLCADPSITFNPVKLGFIPGQFWQDQHVPFGQLVQDFFQRKNNANSRFSHKLFNALRITLEDQFYVDFIGIEWVTDKVLRIDKRVFARLLGIKIVDGSLFHQQGNFPSHGFVELSEKNALEWVSAETVAGVDFDNVRLLIHQEGIVTKNCTEADIDRCKWKSARKRSQTAGE
jgi:hypothetical protein